jgi:hypothetical protein
MLFNLVGYRMYLHYLEVQHDTVLEKRMDENSYDPSAVFILKSPVTLPYYTNSETYERVNGSVEVEGIAYKYIKRRIYNDSIELVCLPNPKKQQLESARDLFFQLANDFQAERHAAGHSGNPVVIKILLPEFFEEDASVLFPQIDPYRTWCAAPDQKIPLMTVSPQDRPPDSIG